MSEAPKTYVDENGYTVMRAIPHEEARESFRRYHQSIIDGDGSMGLEVKAEHRCKCGRNHYGYQHRQWREKYNYSLKYLGLKQKSSIEYYFSKV